MKPLSFKKYYFIFSLFFIINISFASKKQISLFTWVPYDEYKLNTSLINEFQKKNPDIEVKYINEPGPNAMQKLQVMFAGGTPPDVMSIHGAYFLPFASKGMLLELEEFFNYTESLKITDFYSKLIEGCRYEGKLYSLPRYTSVYVLFYNKTLFDKEKINYPDYSWTWKEFLSTAIKLTRDHDNDGRIDQYGYAIDFWGSRIYPWIWQNGGRTFDPQKNKCYLNEPETVEAIQFLIDMKHKYKVTPVDLPIGYKTNVEMFRSGKVGMIISGAWEIQNLKSEKSYKWDIAPLPKGKKRATMLGMENYAISSKTKDKISAYKLLEFLLCEKIQLITAEKLDKQPSLIKAGKIFTKNKKDYNRQVLVDAIEYGIVPPNLKQYNEIEPVLQRELDLIWLGKKTVTEGLNTATEKINKILEKK